jgi:peptidoglycan/xylan/chitin deacetylase (PgdA/CDA1 family)
MLHGKKALLSKVWTGAGLANALLTVPPVAGDDRLIILAYHRVFDVADEDSFPFDPELISAGTAAFAAQMKFVRKHFTPIRFSDVIDAKIGGRRLPRRPIVVTFDDGHLDNFTHAFPVLKDLGIPATIFLSSGYIGAAGTFWFDRLAELLFRAEPGPLRLTSLAYSVALGDVASRRHATELLQEALKRVPNSLRLQVIAELDGTLGMGLAPLPGSAVLNWEQVREMAGAGIEFGSHTVSHPTLTMLDDDELHRELYESRMKIQQETGQPVEVVGYPVGNAYAFDERVVQAAKSCGYKLGVSYVSGVSRMGDPDEFALRRLHIERQVTFAEFCAMLSLPGVFG